MGGPHTVKPITGRCWNSSNHLGVKDLTLFEKDDNRDFIGGVEKYDSRDFLSGAGGIVKDLIGDVFSKRGGGTTSAEEEEEEEIVSTTAIILGTMVGFLFIIVMILGSVLLYCQVFKKKNDHRYRKRITMSGFKSRLEDTF